MSFCICQEIYYFLFESLRSSLNLAFGNCYSHIFPPLVGFLSSHNPALFLPLAKTGANLQKAPTNIGINPKAKFKQLLSNLKLSALMSSIGWFN